MEDGAEKFLKPDDQGFGCGITSPRNARSYTHKASSTWLPKYELSKVTIDILKWMEKG